MSTATSEPKSIMVSEALTGVKNIVEVEIPDLQKEINFKIDRIENKIKKYESNMTELEDMVEEFTLASKDFYPVRCPKEIFDEINEIKRLINSDKNKFEYHIEVDLEFAFINLRKLCDDLNSLKKRNQIVIDDLTTIIQGQITTRIIFNITVGNLRKDIERAYRDFDKMKDDADYLFKGINKREECIDDLFIKGSEEFLENTKNIAKRELFSEMLTYHRGGYVEQKKPEQDESKVDSSTVVSKGENSEEVFCETTMPNTNSAEVLDIAL